MTLAALKRLGPGREQLWSSLALSLTLFQHSFKGRVFKIASTLVKKVLNSSKVRTWFPRLRFRWYLVDLMPLSHNPPSEALQVD